MDLHRNLKKIDWLLPCAALIYLAASSYEHGAWKGLLFTTAVAFALALFVASMSVSLGFLVRAPLFTASTWIWIGYALAYLIVCVSMGHTERLRVGLLGLVCGLVLGAILGLTSRYNRWR